MGRLAIEIEEDGNVSYALAVVTRALGRVGSQEYQSLPIIRGAGEIEDVIKQGEYACAYETTCALHNLGLLAAVHTTVDGFEAEVQDSADWLKLARPMTGAIGILEPKRHLDGRLGTRHTFTCISHSEAVHNDADPSVRVPQRIEIADFRHHTGEQRLVQAYYVHRLVFSKAKQ